MGVISELSPVTYQKGMIKLNHMRHLSIDKDLRVWSKNTEHAQRSEQVRLRCLPIFALQATDQPAGWTPIDPQRQE